MQHSGGLNGLLSGKISRGVSADLNLEGLVTGKKSMAQPDAIDVTKLHEAQLLERLGTADWVIALPEGLPDLTITPQWRHALQAHAGKQFVRWVTNGLDKLLTHDADPPWDHSGYLYRINADPLMLLVRHNSLSTWAKNEYTGQNRATFVCGMGLWWKSRLLKCWRMLTPIWFR
jgi:hypothetical protein